MKLALSKYRQSAFHPNSENTNNSLQNTPNISNVSDVPSESQEAQPANKSVLENYQNYLKSAENPPYSSKKDNLYRKDLGLNGVSDDSSNLFVAIADKDWNTFYCDGGTLEAQNVTELPDFHSKILSNQQHIYVFTKSGVLLGFAKPIDKVTGKDDVVIQFGKSILVFDKKSPINYKGIDEFLSGSKVKSTLNLDKINISKKAHETISSTMRVHKPDGGDTDRSLMSLAILGFFSIMILPDVFAESRKRRYRY